MNNVLLQGHSEVWADRRSIFMQSWRYMAYDSVVQYYSVNKETSLACTNNVYAK